MLYPKEVLISALVNDRRADWTPDSSKSEPQTYLRELEEMTVSELESKIDNDQELPLLQYVEKWA